MIIVYLDEKYSKHYAVIDKRDFSAYLDRYIILEQKEI